MKLLIISVIVLVVPAFFLMIFVMGTYGRLSSLRRRCGQPGTQLDPTGEQAHKDAIALYDEARTTFPANLVARLFGFGPATARRMPEQLNRDR